ncbi:Wzz/FepE/Etk N-terminal domain-containing protein [[Clostridium] innocuum]|nr:Wzz/FepE/Etk N-terminal domain-containing protein [[Clostridium] innocuum]
MEDLQKSIEQNEEIEIDLGRLLRQLRKKLSFIIAVTVIAIIISLLVTKFLIPKKYESRLQYIDCQFQDGEQLCPHAAGEQPAGGCHGEAEAGG